MFCFAFPLLGATGGSGALCRAYESYVFVDETSQQLLALVERVGASEVTVLLQGATGSGKEVLARLAHDFSPRRDGPFVPVNCAALPENLAESLLFGHVRGAFTGATRNTEGFFTQAQGAIENTHF